MELMENEAQIGAISMTLMCSIVQRERGYQPTG